MMKRPRNRQPRQGQQSQQRGGSTPQFNGRTHPGTPQQAAGTVPRSTQVIPGAAVFIILKDDQPTGRETRGVVQTVLTAGDHPRGIKVRLRDGQVGRVQRLYDGSSEPSSGSATVAKSYSAPSTSSGFSSRYTDARYDDEFPEGPPPRSLADFMPDLDEPVQGASNVNAEDAVMEAEQYETVVCPMCEAFEGDEAAVTHHIDREHLS